MDRVTSLVFLSFVACVIFPAALAYAGVEGDKELLSLVADVHRTNKSHIHSWSGNVEIKDRQWQNADQTYVANSEVDFVYDATTERLRFNWTTISLADQPAGSGTLSQNGIVTKDSFAEMRIDQVGDDVARTVVIRSRTEFSVGPLSTTFDPNYFFGYRGEDVAKRFSVLHTYASEPALNGWKVTRDGDLVTMEHKTETALNRYVVDLAKGGTLVRYEASASVAGTNELLESENCKWTYEKLDDTWVPKFHTYEKIDHFEFAQGKQVPSQNGVRKVREMTWINNRINEPLTDEDFDLVRLGLQNGDTINDTLTGKEYQFVAPQGPFGPKFFLILGNVVVLIVIFLLMLKRHLGKAAN